MTSEVADKRLRPTIDPRWPAGHRPMIADVKSLTGHEDQLRAAVVNLTAAARRQPGCVSFDAFESFEHPGHFHLVEIYADTAAFEAHLDTPHVHRFFDALRAHSSATADDLTQLTQLA